MLEIKNIDVFYGDAQALWDVSLAVDVKRPRFGMALRATAQDREAATILGINFHRIYLLTFGISSAVAALAATMLAPIFLVNPWMGIPPQLKAFIVVVLGGLGRVGELWGSHSWGVFTGVHRKPGHCLSFLGVERCGGLWSSHLFLSF